jgi:hypothetical protein
VRQGVPTPYEENPTAVARVLTEEERHDIEKKREQDDVFRSAQGIAKFKIELMFTKSFSIINPVPGIMSFWESGSQLHGGGDAIMHFCPGKKLGKNECDHFIPDPSHGYGFLVCPGCRSVWKGSEVYGQIIGRHTSQKWAELIELYYRRLEMNCDIVIKHHKDDIRSAASARHSADSLAVVRSAPKRLKRIYTLASLMKDVSAGSALYDRIYAFVRA